MFQERIFHIQGVSFSYHRLPYPLFISPGQYVGQLCSMVRTPVVYNHPWFPHNLFIDFF